MKEIPLLHAGTERVSEDQEPLASITGQPLARVSHAPSLLARHMVKMLRTVTPSEDERWRLTALAHAVDLFATAEIAGESPQSYQRSFAAATGIPVAVAQRAALELQALAQGLPAVVTQDLAVTHAVTGGVSAAVHRVPRGDVLGVIAPSNHPATHGSWLRALAYGLRVVVRSGSRDPFTPVRLARAVGLAFGQPCPLSVIHGPHAVADAVVESADLALVYGSDAAIARFGAGRHTALRGPGRSKAILSGPPSTQDLDYLTRAIAGDSGIRCTNLSTVLTDQPPARIADAIVQRLGAWPVLPPHDERAVLPAFPLAQARALAERVEAMGIVHTPPGGLLADLGDGTAVLRGAAVVTGDRDRATSTELPFPFATVTGWQPQEGVAPGRDSLVLVLLGAAEKLAAEALADPTIRKVVAGHVDPWSSAPHLPHEGHLAEFFLEAKAMLTTVGGTR